VGTSSSTIPIFHYHSDSEQMKNHGAGEQSSIEELSNQGFQCLELQDYQGALEIASRLEEHRSTAAFEIAALALAGDGQLEKAVETLERGVGFAPDVWLNWQLLGNYCSDLGQMDRARIAYQCALDCPHVSEFSVRLNQAILEGRDGQFETAMNKLAEAEGSKDPESLGSLIEATRGWLALKQGSPSAAVVSGAISALEQHGDHPELFRLIRDAHDTSSERAKYFRILVHAEIPATHTFADKGVGFFSTYDVVDESVEQAMRWIERLENADGGDLILSSESAELLAKRPDDPFGVYLRTARSFYLTD
jgi:tetratricopeptide (TPR) repeat protein